MIFFYFKLRVTWNELSRFLRRNFFQHYECSVELDGRVYLLPKSTETNPLPKITLEDPYSEMVGVIMVLRCCCSINSRNASNLRIWYWQNPFNLINPTRMLVTLDQLFLQHQLISSDQVKLINLDQV